MSVSSAVVSCRRHCEAERIKRLREKDDLEDTAYAFLGLLGKLKRPHLIDLEEEMLSVFKRTYGQIKVK